MFQQVKWFGLSLALHLALAASLIAVASRNVERTPKTIMVVLDTHAPPKTPHTAAAHSVTRSVVPVRRPKAAKPEVTRQEHQPSAPQLPTAPPATGQDLTRDLPNSAPEAPVAATNRPKVEGDKPVPPSQVKIPAQHPEPALKERPAPEKARQRYLKEHFAYIRDLITKRLTYPPIARKMRWSGKTVVSFIIDEDGAVHNIQVVESSGYPILDKNATETVRTTAPFPKPPVRAEIVVPISFKMIQ